MKQNEMILKLENNSIKNEELYDCLMSKNLNVLMETIYKIIERKFCDENIIMALTKISPMLNGYKLVGPYQIGHLAIGALALVNNELALEKFKQIYSELNDNDKFIVDNYIKGMKQTQ